MENYTLGVAGIAVSVFLFILGYRQTIGARKERTGSANNDIERILIRRIFLESYTPTLIDLSRLIEGKARDFRLRPSDLLSESQLLNSVFTRIIESDFIASSQREETLTRLESVIQEAEDAGVEVEEAGKSSSTFQRTMPSVLVTALALTASLSGALVVSLPAIRQIGGLQMEIASTILASMVGSLAIIGTFLVFLRLRDTQQEEPSKQSTIDRYAQFEKDVAQVLSRLRLQRHPVPADSKEGDFLVSIGQDRILMEVKIWIRPRPTFLLKRLVDSVNKSLKSAEATEAIIVTRDPIRIADEELLIGKKVQILTLDQLRSYLIQKKSSTK